MRTVLVGPPGAGKGTQATFIAKHFRIPQISTGDIFRANVTQETELGIAAKKYMDAGDLVPDEVTIAMVRDRLAEKDAVLELAVDHEEVVRRLSGRRTCHGCGRNWHVEFDKPADKGVCDACGGELFRRDDDSPDTVRHRLKVYADQTAPLVAHYEKAGLLVRIDASGSVEEITERAIAALESGLA